MIWGLTLLFSLYLLSMAVLIYSFRKVAVFASEAARTKTRFSIVIPFRDEAENLPKLLQTVEKLSYPSALFEVIFVNDASRDTSEAIITEAIQNSGFSIKLIQNKRFSNSPKKDAITEAIKTAKNEWIICTDADCELPKNWLRTFDSFIQTHKPLMVCAPVLYKSAGNFVEDYQQLDGLSLQTVTLGSFGLGNPLLNNGANLAYSKDAFYKLDGFSGNDHIASGDDIFLLEKIKKHFPERLYFLKSKEAIVTTSPQKTWKNILNQRIRWASKTSKQKNASSILLGMLVFFVNLSVLAIPFLIAFNPEFYTYYLSLLLLKIAVDYTLVKQAAHFFEVKVSFLRFSYQPIVYAAIVLLVVLGSLSGNYSWKGRSFKKQG